MTGITIMTTTSLHRPKMKLCHALVVSSLLALSAQAQQTSRVKIVLGACIQETGLLTVVVNGDEKGALNPRERDREGNWIATVKEPFFISDGVASLRVNGSRTGCRGAVAADDEAAPRYASVAKFTFMCDEREAWNVVIEPKPGIHYSYVRRLPRDKTSTDALDRDCIEDGAFIGRKTALAVRFPDEELRIQLGVTKPDRHALGLRVNSLPKTRDGFHTPDGILVALLYQRARADQTVPTLSSTAIDIDTKNLKQLKLEGLFVTVGK
jgi:hypothetical protein